ncbi:YncE family protein [Streptomyces kronopolitis]|uniref:YncE family protein n=1 Tax=Streptomyces kronopolitis TaxID=1612435 RepID=UPI003449752F
MTTSVQSSQLLQTALPAAPAAMHLFLATTTIPVGTNPVGLAFIPNGDLYVTNSGSNNVQTIDTATDTVIGAAIPTGTTPVWLAVAPNGSAYVPNNGSNSRPAATSWGSPTPTPRASPG